MIFIISIGVGVLIGWFVKPEPKPKKPGILLRISPTETKLYTSLNNERIITTAMMKEFMDNNEISYYNFVNYNHNTDIVDIYLPEAIEISENVFSYFVNLASVSLPRATTFGNNAFSDCPKLTSVSLPKATEFGDEAFSDCYKLTSVSLPKATEFGDDAFYRCLNLTSVSLPEATAFEKGAFEGCNGLTSVSLPKATIFGFSAFRECTSLTSVSLPKAIEFGNSAFRECTSLTSVSLPEAIEFRNDAFRECTSLTSISLPKTTSFGGKAFYNCTNLRSISLPKTTSFGGKAFYRCINLGGGTKISGSDGLFSELTPVYLPEVITFHKTVDEGEGPFILCINLASVSLPKTTGLNGGDAFRDCYNLISVSLPKVTEFGDNAFDNCDRLNENNDCEFAPDITFMVAGVATSLLGASGAIDQTVADSFDDGGSVVSINFANNPLAGYNSGDTGALTGGTGSGAMYLVTSVFNNSMDYTITYPGFGYAVGDVLTLDGNGTSALTITVQNVVYDATGLDYTIDSIGSLVTVFSADGVLNGTGAKYIIKGVKYSGMVTQVEVLDNFRGTGYSVGDVLRCDGNGNGKCFIRVETVVDGSLGDNIGGVIF